MADRSFEKTSKYTLQRSEIKAIYVAFHKGSC